MRKMLFFVILLIIGSQMIFAAPLSDEAYLQIKAYRINPVNYHKIDIVDAISENLNTNPSEIDITRHLNSFVSEYDAPATASGSSGTEAAGEPDIESMFSEHVVFAYRVAGNETGTFTVKLTFEPFILESDPTKFIGAVYEIGNVSYTFTQSGGSSYSLGGTEYMIAEVDDSSPIYTELSTVDSSDSLIKKWNITGTGVVPEWIVRGAVSLYINPDEYDNAAFGNYSSNVTVVLEST